MLSPTVKFYWCLQLLMEVPLYGGASLDAFNLDAAAVPPSQSSPTIGRKARFNETQFIGHAKNRCRAKLDGLCPEVREAELNKLLIMLQIGILAPRRLRRGDPIHGGKLNGNPGHVQELNRAQRSSKT